MANITDTLARELTGTRTVLIRLYGKLHAPEWTRHFERAGRTVCGLRPTLLRRANDGDPQLDPKFVTASTA